MNTDEEPIAKRRKMAKKRKARWLARQNQESLDRIHAVDVAACGRRIEAETPAQSHARRERDAAAHSRRIERQTPDLFQASVKIYTKTSEVQGKLLNNEKLHTECCLPRGFFE
ncbi:hypothetical protein AVEN_2228-1 [Araneus ventricosus]|uniref:Uncharacterized protein n=1 Tax=Araneus ventricosus TaxID=182803 RepID=A0A4Y2P1R1_ARAVE|nr:hypothetical protein AVEN_2228-1 [Araneus ventricosus]